MTKCENCGHENPDEEKLCIKCSLPLGAAAAQSQTHRLENITDDTNYPRWGTARLGTERKLLIHIRNHDTPVVVHLEDKLVLGRHDIDTGTSPEIDLAEYDAQNLGVSRRHACLMLEDDTIKVVDLGSANFTFMNGQKLIAHQARILRDGDELRLGRLVLRVNFV